MFKKHRTEQDFREEIESHLQLESDELGEDSASGKDAKSAARRSFGNVMQAEERFYEEGRVLWWEHLREDVRFGIRMLLKAPGFTAVSILILGLAIGANTAIFSAVYAVLLRPLPFRNPEQLVFIEKQNRERGWVRNNISPPEILAWREQADVFQQLAAMTLRSCVITGGGEAQEVPCELATGNLFSVLDVAPFRGRGFLPDEDKAETPRAAILSYAFWQRRFGGDERAVGRGMVINGISHTIVGVMPPSLSHLYASPFAARLSSPLPELWISGIGLRAENVWNDYWGVARLKPGVSLQQASAQMDSVSARLEKTEPGLKGWRSQLMTLRTLNSQDTRPALLVLMAAVLFVLLIACANMANLLLARGASRGAEFAARTALGASRGRIVRQLLTESFTLSIAGGALGVLVASFGCKALVALAPPYLVNSAPSLVNGATTLQVLAYSVLTVVVTTIVFSLAPALQGSRQNLAEVLKEGGRGSLQTRGSKRFRSTMVISEVALALVLLVGAGLMVRTLTLLSAFKLGFNPTNVLTMKVSISGERYGQSQSIAHFWEQVVSGVERLPGVESAAVSRDLPVDGWDGQFFTIAEQPNPPAGQVPDANYIVIGGDYFGTMQIPLRQGRFFNDHDMQSGAPVVIINEELVRRHWPSQNPLGKRLRPGLPSDGKRWLTVVGVAANVYTRGADGDVSPEIYVPLQQFPWLLTPRHLAVRTSPSVQPERVAHAIVDEIHRVDTNLPVTEIVTMEQLAAEPLRQQRMVMALLTAFAGLALGLAGLGVYGVLSYSTAQRTREIGVRIALGAQQGSVLRLIIGDGLRLAAVGIVLGTAAALGLTRLMTDLLFGVKPTDTLTFTVAILVVTGTAIAACHLPARRAMKIDPIVALRHE
jgi:predicted permease